MRRTVEYALLALVIGALAAYLWLRPTDRSHYQIPALSPIDAAMIDRIVIHREKATATLEKRQDRWLLVPGDFPADPDKAKTIVDTASRLTLTALVSESKDYGRYDLAPPRRIGVEVLAQNQVKRRFDIGKSAPSFRHTFVKIEGDERVWHALENFRRHFDQSADDLRDKNVFGVDGQGLTTIELIRGDTTVVFNAAPLPADQTADPTQPPARLWHRQDGATVDQGKIRRLLTTLGRLRCSAFIEDRSKDDLTDPMVTLRVENGGWHSLSLFAPGQEEDAPFPSVSSQNPYAFWLSAHDAKTILEAADLAPADPVQAPAPPGNGR